MAACAMRAGAGVVKLAAPRSLAPVILPNILESTFYPLSDLPPAAGDRYPEACAAQKTENGACDVGASDSFRFVEEEWAELTAGTRVTALGMGIGHSNETKKVVQYLLQNYGGILILDADALNALADMGCGALREAKCGVILTPHLGEFSRLCGRTIPEIREHARQLAAEFAEEYGVTLLLKGPTNTRATLVTDGQILYEIDRGCPGMATAGSGDVLSGILAAVCAQNVSELPMAAAVGAYLAGAAGELAQERNCAVTMLASDTASCVRDVLNTILRGGEGEGEKGNIGTGRNSE